MAAEIRLIFESAHHPPRERPFDRNAGMPVSAQIPAEQHHGQSLGSTDDHRKYCLFGTPIADLRNGITPIVHAITAEFDPSFNFQGGWMVESISSNHCNTI
jgi:hypothetical protein